MRDDESNQLLRLAEAILFAAKEPLTSEQVAARLPEECAPDELLPELQSLYANRGINLVRPGGKWAFRTAPDLAPKLDLERESPRSLSKVGVETLAIIAYHQPVTRAEVEEIRGVAVSKGTLDILLECAWIKPGRRRETPGRPVTWVTTPEFLNHFGLEGLRDLPGISELREAGLLEKQTGFDVYANRSGEMELEDEDDSQDPEEDLLTDLEETDEGPTAGQDAGQDDGPNPINEAAAAGADTLS